MMDETPYFPEDYRDSRQRFLARAGKIQGPVERGEWKIPSRTDDDLVVDFAYLPPTGSPKQLYILISGVHGLEAYAGAAIQSMFMDEILPRADRRETGFLIVHSFNPYGFKHHLRGTESHVNLNRNFSSTPSLYAYRNPESLKVSEFLIPKSPASSIRFQLPDLEGRSLDDVIKAVGPGQFENPRGLEYGGREPEPQTRALVELLKRIQPQYRDVIALDLHTGLGDRGRLHLITGEKPESLDPALFAELFHVAADRAVYHFTPAETEGFYKVEGASNDLFMELAPPGQRIVALTMEFGTLGHSREDQQESLSRWLVHHQGTHYGYAEEKIESEVKQAYLDKFYPRAADWRSMVVGASRSLFRSLLERSGAWAG